MYRLRLLQLQRRTVGSRTHLAAATPAAAAADCRCATAALILRWPRPMEAALPEGVFLIYNMLMDTVAGRQGQLDLCEDDVISKCDSPRILEPWCHIVI